MSIINLEQKDAPTHYYNIVPDLPKPLSPPLHPATKKPIGPDDLAAIFPMELIKQEVSTESQIEIPEEVRKAYQLYRPSPLIRAKRLEKELDTPAKIYYKYEGVSPTGSHKPNTAIAQAYYNKKEGVKRLATETGAGQWGSALSFACNLFGLECTVYMVKVSYDQKPYRKFMMQVWGGKVIASPSNLTQSGKMVLTKNPDSPGSLGIAISEAVDDAATHGDTNYALGSVLNHVILHQTIVGLETQKQLKIAGEKPDILIACVGGGSNFGGFTFPFIPEKLKGNNIKMIAVEPTSCPTLTKGPFRYDHGDVAKFTPLMMIYTLGHTFVPPAIHAGGLRYHGAAPLVSLLLNKKIIEAAAYPQNTVFEAAITFAKTEGILPAPETAHAIKCAIDEAIKCRETNEEKCIVFNFSGHGHFDLASYDKFLSGKLEDYELPDEEIKKALGELPEIK